MFQTAEDGERFWSYVDQSGGPDACWPWRGYRRADGYGQFHLDGRTEVASRLALEDALEVDLPDGVIVRHTCDNPPCCNPRHLVQGSHADNAADREQAGHTAKGERNGRAKLTDQQATEIRWRFWLGRASPLRLLAREYGVSERAIRFIVKGEHYSHLPPLSKAQPYKA